MLAARRLAFSRVGGGLADIVDLPGLILDLSADYGVYEATSDPAENGDQIDTWVGAISGVTATGIGTSTKPIYQTGIINGLPAAYGSGAWQHGAFNFSSRPALTAFTCYVVARADTGGLSATRYLAGDTITACGWAFNSSGVPSVRWNSGAVSSFSDALSVNTWYIMTLHYEGSNLRLYKNGTEDSASPVSASSLTFTLGSTVRQGDTTARWAGHIPAYYWFDEAHDADQRAIGLAYLQDKYGL